MDKFNKTILGKSDEEDNQALLNDILKQVEQNKLAPLSQIVPSYVKQKIVFVCNDEKYLPKLEQYIECYFHSTIIVRASRRDWIEVMIVCCLFENYETANIAYDMLIKYISEREDTSELLSNIHALPIRYTGLIKYITVNAMPHIQGRKQELHETLQSITTMNPSYITEISNTCLYIHNLTDKKV